MDFFSRSYKGLLGEKGQPQSVEDTVAKLVDRASSSTLLEDRRAAILGLKGLSREYRQEVGEKGIGALLHILNEDRADIDTAKAVLEILNILCTPDRQDSATDVAIKFTDEIVQNSANINLFLDILQEYDFYVRFHDIQLLGTLLAIRPDHVQDCVLTAPMGISRLMDLLGDRREIIRNEGLLLLISLTENNADIQKIVAFENAFEKLLEIITEEDGLNGGIIVQDCLHLILNLLRYNVSNQNFFRETSCIQKIPPLLNFSAEYQHQGFDLEFLTQDWHEQKIANTIVLLELIKILVVPNNMNTVTNQNVMIQCGVLKTVIELSLSSNAPSIVKSHSLYAFGRPHKRESKCENDAKSSSYDQILIPPRPAVMSLIVVAVGAEYLESYSTRAAATYAFESYTFNNINAQLVLASTLTPPPDDNPNSEIIIAKPQSAGSLLLSALLEWEDSEADPYVVWFASIKEYARGIFFGDGDDNGEENITLLHTIAGNLMIATRQNAERQNADVRVLIRISLYSLHLVMDSPISVREFLSESGHLQMLITSITQSSGVDARVQGLCAFLLGICYEFNHNLDPQITKSTLQQILLNRIGYDQFVNRITRLRESPHFKHASQYLQVVPEEAARGLPELYFDYAFVEFFKNNYETIQRSIRADPNTKSFSGLKGSDYQGDNDSTSVIASYKDVIQTQEKELSQLKESIKQLEQQLESQKLSAEGQIKKDLTALNQEVSDIEEEDDEGEGDDDDDDD
ncbi:unnamed protein product [Rhizophagus irregularis]|nr:unnamed protein product [Rhizophagus irregularis]